MTDRACPPRRRWSDSHPRDGWFPVLAITFAVAILDWSTKAIVAATVPVGRTIELWNGRLAIWHVKNPEMVLGLWGSLPDESRMVIAATAAVLGVLLIYELVERGHRLLPLQRIWVWLFIGLAFGGMLGNLGERMVHWAVTDFISVRVGDLWLPPANFADLALFLSMPVAIPVMIFELQARARRRVQAAAYAAPAASSQAAVAVELEPGSSLARGERP